ncbi:hypothetical protein N5P37_010522 [Trichoderma harzianum]|nr:hypothetical protein N5P37_010522 [Trichoderma harzianum]
MADLHQDQTLSSMGKIRRTLGGSKGKSPRKGSVASTSGGKIDASPPNSNGKPSNAEPEVAKVPITPPRQKIAELPEAKVPRGLVSVRTIDDSPSHQAESVICNLVPNSGPGFLIEHQRLAVMTTRAQGLTILVGQQDILHAKGSTAFDASRLQSHAGASLETFRNIPPLDDVSRAAFSSIKLGKVADSVKKLKLQRKQQREDANANAYAQQMRQTTTDYADYIRARGSAQPVSETIAGPSTKPDRPPREMQLTIQPAAQESVANPQSHFILSHLSFKPITFNTELYQTL